MFRNFLPNGLCATLLVGAATAFATPAVADPAHVILTVPAGGTLPTDLATTVADWRQSGAIADAIWLEQNQRNGAAFDTFVELDFPSDADYQRWAQTQRSKLPGGVEVHPVATVLHAETYPRDSNYSVFTVTTLPAGANAAGTIKPLLDKQRSDKTVMRYTLYRDKDAAGRQWLLTEYRDPTAFDRGSGVGADVSAKLSGVVTKANYLELPAPLLANLPTYKAETKLTGTLRIYGSELKNSVEYLARGFQRYHPDLRITWSNATSSEGAIAGLYTGISDVAPSGDDGKLTDQMPFFNAMGYMPTEISVSTGGYERRGSLFAWAIVVNKDNPLKSISIDELQNVFGAERSGGWDIDHNNILYTAAYAKTKASNIRTWDQLGLGSEYRGKEIMTYGYSAPGFQQAIERHWFHWSHKWNPNFMEYVEAKMAVAGPDGDAVKSERPLEILSKDKYGIGIAALLHVKDYPNLKVLPLSWKKGGPPIAFTPENVANRTYPMIRDGYFYINKAPGQPLDPKVREFMRFVLSREGQQIIAKVGYYYPLDAKMLADQRKKLDN
ncbi:substrate-binding domain-containing protein [Sphingomonas bacterium]|uniref:PstS family phosphate ABC transporter substrate-binding protein n=1 Tax=Sphingomonas bacterium TaxID=1895847 RepID=UPI002639D724|nr:substrate-binding domain-containing protein [Sphingomonas bacterium]MDB5679503.1 ABC-type phosphate transport system, substrate-binding protein [Sphingomonas bacterium]